MRFLSTDSAKRAGETKAGYAAWPEGCRDDCKEPIVGKQFDSEQGRCYVKVKGMLKM